MICPLDCGLPTPVLGHEDEYTDPLLCEAHSLGERKNDWEMDCKRVWKLPTTPWTHAKEFWLYTLVMGTLKMFLDLTAAASGNRLFHWQAMKCLFLTFLWKPCPARGLPPLLLQHPKWDFHEQTSHQIAKFPYLIPLRPDMSQNPEYFWISER